MLRQFVVVFNFTKALLHPSNLICPEKGLSLLFQNLNFFQPHSHTETSKLVTFQLFLPLSLFFLQRKYGRGGEEIVGG